MVIEFEVKEILEEGKHEGKITNVEFREQNGYNYLDVYISVGNKYMLRAGFPANISKKSLLGQLLEKAGMKLQAGQKIKLTDIKKLLEGRTIEFVTVIEEGFNRVVRESIKFK